jgi:hypothetical protein
MAQTFQSTRSVPIQKIASGNPLQTSNDFLKLLLIVTNKNGHLDQSRVAIFLRFLIYLSAHHKITSNSHLIYFLHLYPQSSLGALQRRQ